jgi:hypothetical protein
MIVLSIYGYRNMIQSGFWGNNYKTYAFMKNKITKQMEIKNSLNRPTIVYYDKETGKSNYYLYLLAHGIILMREDKMEPDNNNLYNKFILVKDTANSINILRVN